MTTARLIAIALLVAWSGSSIAVRLSDLAVDGSEIGPGWVGPSGVVIDDFDDPSTVADEHRAAFRLLRPKLSPMGVRSVADFTYHKSNDFGHQITVRVFVFDSAEQAQDWIQKKYQYEGWEAHYKAVTTDAMTAFDSRQMRKRGASFGNVWITSGTIATTDEHLRVLHLYADILRPK